MAKDVFLQGFTVEFPTFRKSEFIYECFAKTVILVFRIVNLRKTSD